MITFTEGTFPAVPPKTVQLLARSIASEKIPNPIPIKWRMSRKEDEGEGLLVIIFEHGPSLMFTEEQIKAVEFPKVMHNKAEAEEVVKTLTPKPKKEK